MTALIFCGDEQCIQFDCIHHQRHAGQGINSPLHWSYFKNCTTKKVKPEKKTK